MSKNEKETLANLIRILSDYKGVAEGLRQRILVLQEKDDTKSDEYFSLLHWHSNAMIKYWEIALILFEEWDLQILEFWPKDRMEWEIKFWRSCHEDHASRYGSNGSERAA
jgi:hypothetical protein